MFPPVSPAVRPHASLSIDTRSNSTVLQLAERAEGWVPGDRVVVASTDYSMNQAEEFTLLPCPSCSPTQVKVQGESSFCPFLPVTMVTGSVSCRKQSHRNVSPVGAGWETMLP